VIASKLSSKYRTRGRNFELLPPNMSGKKTMAFARKLSCSSVLRSEKYLMSRL
jgi:hypothetical protein